MAFTQEVLPLQAIPSSSMIHQETTPLQRSVQAVLYWSFLHLRIRLLGIRQLVL